MNDLLPYIALGIIVYVMYQDSDISDEQAKLFANLNIGASTTNNLKFTPYMDKIINKLNSWSSNTGTVTQVKGLFTTVANFCKNLTDISEYLATISKNDTIRKNLNNLRIAFSSFLSDKVKASNISTWEKPEFIKGITDLLNKAKPIAAIWENNKGAFIISNAMNKSIVATAQLLQIAVLNVLTII